MVGEIIHTAIARKMLCSPVNSLIADTEFACAAGVWMKRMKAGEEERKRVEELSDIPALKSFLLSFYADDAEKVTGESDNYFQNLWIMIKEYQAGEAPFTPELKELFLLGFEKELKYPKGRFM